MLNINQAICLRLDTLENKLDKMNYRLKALEEKMEQVGDRIAAKDDLDR